MSPIRRHFPVLAAGLLLAATPVLPAAEPANSAEIKRVTDRYALTKTRIDALLEQRLNPTPLPANPPNPFYVAPVVAPGDITPVEPDETALIPEAADISDIDTLRKFAATMRVGGVITHNDIPHVTINNTACKVGDVITIGSKDRPTYLKLVSLTPASFTLELNDATLSIPLKK